MLAVQLRRFFWHCVQNGPESLASRTCEKFRGQHKTEATKAQRPQLVAWEQWLFLFGQRHTEIIESILQHARIMRDRDPSSNQNQHSIFQVLLMQEASMRQEHRRPGVAQESYQRDRIEGGADRQVREGQPVHVKRIAKSGPAINDIPDRTKIKIISVQRCDRHAERNEDCRQISNAVCWNGWCSQR